MSSYEIRLSNREETSPKIMRVRRVSDFAAIRNARSIAKAGESVEVWKGAECIYAAPLQSAAAMH